MNEILTLCAIAVSHHDCLLCPQWIPREQNQMSDALSKDKLDEFHA